MQKRILREDRIRQTSNRFSFVPHRFLLEGFFKSLTPNELVLYFFLTLAADKNGISYYGQKSICDHIQREKAAYEKALTGLVVKDLVLFDGVFFQVLELPSAPVFVSQISRKGIRDLCSGIGNGGENA